MTYIGDLDHAFDYRGALLRVRTEHNLCGNPVRDLIELFDGVNNLG